MRIGIVEELEEMPCVRASSDERVTYVQCDVRRTHAGSGVFLTEKETIEDFMALGTFEMCRRTVVEVGQSDEHGSTMNGY